MSDFKTITTLGRRTPDYTGDKFSAKQMANKLQRYYWDRGFTGVRVWAELIDREGSKLWEIKSNIKFKVPTL